MVVSSVTPLIPAAISVHFFGLVARLDYYSPVELGAIVHRAAGIMAGVIDDPGATQNRESPTAAASVFASPIVSTGLSLVPFS